MVGVVVKDVFFLILIRYVYNKYWFPCPVSETKCVSLCSQMPLHFLKMCPSASVRAELFELLICIISSHIAPGSVVANGSVLAQDV